jgi:hypothetical protein
LGETVVCLLKGGAGVVDGDGYELHLAPERLELVDEGGVLDGLLLAPLVASEVLSEADLDDDQVALLAVEGGGVRRWGVRDSSGVYEVRGCSMSRPEETVLSLEGKYPIWDAGWGCGAFQVSCCRGLVVSWVRRDVRVSPVFSNNCN